MMSTACIYCTSIQRKYWQELILFFQYCLLTKAYSKNVQGEDHDHCSAYWIFIRQLVILDTEDIMVWKQC